MKTILSLIISGALVVSGLGQTRNVLVGTNNTVVQPTNFWSADAVNARSGLGLGTAATNSATAFQPASSTLSNLVSGGALTFTNITVGIGNVTGLQSALDGKLGTNPTLLIANISNLQTALDGKLGTNPTLQISNIAALQTALDGKLSGTFPIAISNVSGLQTSLDGKLGTNPTLAISNISGLQTNLDSKLSLTGNAANLTNFPASLLRTTGDASGLTNFPILNQNTTGTASNVTGVVSIANGGTGTNSVIGARQNLGLVWTGLTNTNAATFLAGLGATTVGGNIFTLANPSAIRFLRLNADNTVSALSDSDFRAAIGLGTAATNPASAFQPSSATLSNLASSNAVNLTNLRATNLVGVIPSSNIPSTTLTNISGTLAIVSGGTGATNASNARVNLGATTVGDAIFIATNAAAARTAIGALATNGNGSGLTSLTAANITGTVALASNVTGTIAISNGGTGATNAATARTNLGLGATWLTNALSPLFTDTNGRIVAPLVVFDSANESEVLRIPSDTSDSVDPVVLGGGWNTSNNRTRLGLGPTNSPRFAGITLQLDEQSLSNSIVAGQQNIEFKVTNVNKLEIGASNASFYVPLVFFGTNTAATTRTNLGLGLSALTNTNTAGFNTSLYGSGTNPVLYNTNGEVVSPTNFWQVAPISTTVQYQTNVTGTSTNAATNSRNLFLFSLTPSVSGVTNTVTLPTNTATTFEGDRATIIHLATNSANTVTAIRQLGAATNLITLNQGDEAVLLMYRSGAWVLSDNISYVEPIFFSGTNAAANAAASRTNLGATTIGNSVFTATNVVAARNALELNLSTGSPISLFMSNVLVANYLSLPTESTGTANSIWISNSQLRFQQGATTNDHRIVLNNIDNLASLNSPATARTNLGLGATNDVTFSNVVASGTLTATSTVTAKTNLVVEGFVNYTAARTNNTPTNTPNFAAHAAWIEVKVGTNSFFLPAYQ